VPVIYYMLARHGRAAELQREGALAGTAPPVSVALHGHGGAPSQDPPAHAGGA
jgi:hypothetical protein